MKMLELTTREDWREWLAENHDRESEVWLIYYKQATGRPSIPYGASVEEALCFGWVDSLIKRIDDQKYARKFTPRKDESAWSAVNKQRVEKMMREKRMTAYGLRKVEIAKRLGHWDDPVKKPKIDLEMTEAFAEALNNNPQAEKHFNALAPTYQKQYLTWIAVAKRPQTKRKRIEESIQLLSEGKKLGLR